MTRLLREPGAAPLDPRREASKGAPAGTDPGASRAPRLGEAARARIRRERARRQSGARAWLLFIVLGLSFVALALRTAPLMLGENPRLQDKARVQFQLPVEVEARRGAILDREGSPMAVSVAMPTLHVNPSALNVSEIPGLADRLSKILEMDREEILKTISRPTSQDVWLAKAVHPARAREALKAAPRGVIWTTDKNRRYYPGRSLAVQALGSVGVDGRGTSGLELSLDHHLRGDTYKYVQIRDRKGRGLFQAAAAARVAHQGATVTLTLDPMLQLAAEDALDVLMETSKPSSANIVVMDVKTGEILAMANRPTTNPNDLARLDPKLLYNHTVQDAHEPGSVFKPFVVSLALEAGVVTENALVDCEGGAWSLGSNTIKDDHPHGTVTLGEVIKYSSNIGSAKMGLRAGAERVVSGLRGFGFGQDPQLGLPYELPGRVRSASSIKPIELATTSFGQGVTATAVQLASGVATIANGGQRMRPYIVKEIRDRRGDLVQSTRPHVVQRVLSEKNANTMKEFMVLVTEPGGTGTRARVAGYRVGGKTGTAQKVENGVYSPTARVSSFIGFAPADDPRVAITVMADTPTVGSKYGGIVSAPAFAQVAAAAMRHLRVPPTEELLTQKRPDASKKHLVETRTIWPPVDEASSTVKATPWAAGDYSQPALALRWSADRRLVLPDLRGLGLRDVLRLVQGSGLEVEILGSGRAVAHNPAPGATLASGDRLEVRFE